MISLFSWIVYLVCNKRHYLTYMIIYINIYDNIYDNIYLLNFVTFKVLGYRKV